MTKKTTGSRKGRINWHDLKVSIIAFLAVFVPIYATELLKNMDEIQKIVTDWFNALGAPEIINLLILPVIVSLFFLARQWLRDNSKK